MKDERASFTLRLPQDKAKAFRIKLATEGLKAQELFERLIDSYLANTNDNADKALQILKLHG